MIGASAMRDKVVLITGGTGSFGKTMARELLNKTEVAEIRICSRDEEKQDAIRHEFSDKRLRCYIGDVRDRSSLDVAMSGADHVFHAAALKQVPSCEFFPMQAVQTNIIGSNNVLLSAIEAGAESVVCLSTDKAVYPINAMGMTKALMEKAAQALARNSHARGKATISCVRYGNVMYSRGSVIPLFVRQILDGKPVTVTDPNMTRFLMPLEHSVELVMHAFTQANAGDIFIKKAPAARLDTLVTALHELLDAHVREVHTIGIRHGEKMFETLATAAELVRSKDLGDYYQIPMDGRDLNYAEFTSTGDLSIQATGDFHSSNATQLDVDGVKSLLRQLPEIQQVLASR